MRLLAERARERPGSERRVVPAGMGVPNRRRVAVPFESRTCSEQILERNPSTSFEAFRSWYSIFFPRAPGQLRSRGAVVVDGCRMM